MLVETGKCYRARNGSKVGPLRPFRDGEDGTPEDIMGRNAWFHGEPFGSYDKHGEYLTGGAEHEFHLVSEWAQEPPEWPEPNTESFSSSELPAPLIGRLARTVRPATDAKPTKEFTIAVWVGFGLLLADVKVSAGKNVVIDRAWIEPKSAHHNKIAVDNSALDSLGAFRAGVGWRSFAAILASRAIEEAQG